MTRARVRLWGTDIGAVRWDAGQGLGFFQYEPAFLPSGIQVAPLTMPLDGAVHSFPALSRDSFHGLPGLLADALPDRYGHALLDAWLATQGRLPGSADPVERLCYTGRRGMGALEFEPAEELGAEEGRPLEVAALVDLASAVLSDRQAFVTRLGDDEDARAVHDILRVGTSAGGARAKAVVAWNPDTGEVRSGQADPRQGFSDWLLKFDGVEGNRDRELADPQGHGLIEYAYAGMAQAAGLELSECRLLREGGRAHFITRRFDRTAAGKLHLQSLGALAHLDYNQPGAHSYEQALLVMRRLGLPMAALEQQFRRMVFNLVARNQDDHVKNIAFLMDKRGRWSLSPAFDVTWAYNPAGAWTGRHQMSVNGRRDDFTREDLRACARSQSLRRTLVDEVLDQVLEAVRRWPSFAGIAGVDEQRQQAIGASHRLDWA